MTQQLKIGAYGVLLGLGIWFGYCFTRNLAAANSASSTSVDPTNEVTEAVSNRIDPTILVTNEVTNAVAETNAAGAINTNAAAITNFPTKATRKISSAPTLTRAERTSRALSWGGGLFAVIVCLGLLVAHDFSHFAANRFQKFIFDDDLGSGKDPEYEEAEKVWANGNHLEAIQLMRDYLKSHPREQYVAIRIAEIYEKDLGNYLAAALEYEEILKKKLPDQRWGWAAIHLANLYSGKLSRGQEAIVLLQRIVVEYGHTAAAKKARERLTAEGIAVPEPVLQESPADDTDKSDPPPSNLPQGFKPKKS